MFNAVKIINKKTWNKKNNKTSNLKLRVLI